MVKRPCNFFQGFIRKRSFEETLLKLLSKQYQVGTHQSSAGLLICDLRPVSTSIIPLQYKLVMVDSLDMINTAHILKSVYSLF